MKTNQKVSRLGLLVLGVLLAGFNATAAVAPACQGKFTLDSETRWGLATLPAGNYTFTLDHAYTGSIITVLHDGRPVARIQAVSANTLKSGRSEIISANGVVREVNLPQIGISFRYQAPQLRHRAAPREPQLAQTHAVTAVAIGQ